MMGALAGLAFMLMALFAYITLVDVVTTIWAAFRYSMRLWNERNLAGNGHENPNEIYALRDTESPSDGLDPRTGGTAHRFPTRSFRRSEGVFR